MKKGVWFVFMFLLLSAMGFVSSQNSLSDLLNSIQPDTVILFGVFIIAFSLLFFSLNRFFKKENTTTSAVISVAIAFLITYAVSRSGMDFSGFLYNFGIGPEVLGVVIPIIIVAGIIFLVIKLAKDSLLVIGGLFIVGSFFVYEKVILIVIGVILIVIRFFIPKNKWNRPEGKGGSGHYRRAGI